MAGAMRKMAIYLGLVEDQGDDYDDFDDYDPRSTRDSRSSGRYDDRYDDRYDSRSARPVSESRSVRTFRADAPPATRPPAPSRAPVDFSRIETIHPRSYNDARRIGEEYRSGVPVIMNLLDMDDVDAKRIVDFAAGLVFGLHGSIERITNKVFLLSPSNVDVGDAARAQIAKDGFFNQS